MRPTITRLPQARSLIAAAACAGLLVVSALVRAENSNQFLPELNAFLTLDERTRAYVFASSTFADSAPGSGGSFGIQNGGVGAHLDFSIAPILRPHLREEDWARNRYLWLRVGYNYLRSLGDAEKTDRFRENRGVFEINGRTLPLAGGFELVGRARLDLRDLDDDTFRRYRLRIGVERRFDIGGRVVIPYVDAENFYDTRYKAWNQQRYRAGAEVELSRGWRIEPYLALTKNSRSEPSSTRALGLVLKFYR